MYLHYGTIPQPQFVCRPAFAKSPMPQESDRAIDLINEDFADRGIRDMFAVLTVSSRFSKICCTELWLIWYIHADTPTNPKSLIAPIQQP